MELSMNFMDPTRALVLNKIEKDIQKAKMHFNKDRIVEFDKSDFVNDGTDILFTPGDLAHYSDIVKGMKGQFNKTEKDYLDSRNFNEQLIDISDAFGMSQLKDSLPGTYDILGISTHPALEKLFDHDFSDGICMPLFDDEGKLINVTTRKIHDRGKLKFTQAVPSVNVYGRIIDSTKPIYLVEGLFDMYVLLMLGLNAFSSSTANWSSYQISEFVRGILYSIKNPEIIIWADNDQTGIRSAAVMQKVLEIPLKSVVYIYQLYILLLIKMLSSISTNFSWMYVQT